MQGFFRQLKNLYIASASMKMLLGQKIERLRMVEIKKNYYILFKFAKITDREMGKKKTTDTPGGE